jgi:signal transduction histidine kinase
MTRILIFVEQSENRRLLVEYLDRYYEVTVGDSVVQSKKALPLLDEPFDLCILDGVALNHLWEWIQARKQKEQPVFLPFLLISLYPEVKLLTRQLWESIDELISKPIEKMELQARVEMLLRARRLSLELHASLERERELNELKSRFISIASHEFRNPLNTILGFMQFLEKQPNLPKEKQAEFFGRIKNSVNRTLTLLDDILLISKAEADKLAFNPVAIAIEPFCRNLTEEIKYSTNTPRNIELIFEGEAVEASFDETLLRQILTNLLSNALKYSPSDRAVRFKIQSQPEAVIFQVQDEGIGISTQDQEQLFNSFYRASNVGSTPGTGLGLAIVKQAVERHGGTIAIASEINVGTTFTVTLPIRSRD